MEVICLEEPAFFSLIEQVVARLKPSDRQEDEWMAPSEAMRLLNIKSKTTLQTLRDTGQIRFSQPQKKIILYARSSIKAYLEKHAQNTF